MRSRSSIRRRQRERRKRDLARELHLTVGRAFGPHLRKLRTRARISQAALAGAHRDRSFIAKLESGASLPSLDTLSDLAATLGVGRKALIPKKL